MSEKKVKKPIYKRWWFIVIMVFLVISIIGSMGNDPSKANDSATPKSSTSEAKAAEPTQADQPETNEETTVASEPEAAPEPSIPTYSDGVYKVGSDIEPGLYKAVSNSFLNMIYLERLKDSNMTFESIISNGTTSNTGYFRILDTDAFVKIQGADLTLFDVNTAEKNILSEYEDGIFLVGIDIEPGEYKVEVTDTITNMGYVERLKDVTNDFDSIIANSIFENQAYVQIESSDFAIRLQGCKLTKSN